MIRELVTAIEVRLANGRSPEMAEILAEAAVFFGLFFGVNVVMALIGRWARMLPDAPDGSTVSTESKPGSSTGIALHGRDNHAGESAGRVPATTERDRFDPAA